MKEKNTPEPTLIERLTLVLSTLSAQLDAAIKEIDDTNIAAIVSIRHLCRLIGYISDAVVAAKSTNDTPADRARVARRYLSQLRGQAEQERMMMNGRRAEAARVELGITTAAIAQFLALIPEADENEVAA
ncbi:hypothetical protein LF916_01695 [Bifidobacterium pseudolongum]|uniref:hypothetical protein n=1 Tax=Bifidobacterium pseudolongum TaxID=1694 RepID=UPI001F0F598C|nr:hypothetical protein [Bifidobacterium pseudolongum]MCH4859609.1 hypothetical protein [Bifidobacterium pseudolongum]MCH4861380.1 hypothetical protein [Bifidobacterium pseudolongum]